MNTIIKTMDIIGARQTPMRVLFLPKGIKSPHFDTEPDNHALIEFYDTRHDHTPDGQFISRYWAETLIESKDLRQRGLDLLGYEDDWKVSARSISIVLDWVLYHLYFL